MNEQQYKTPEIIELELTSKCTLGCAVCSRTMDPEETFSKWKLGELDISVVESLLKLPSVRFMNYTGSFGDPIYHSRLIDIVKLTKQYGKSLQITTNGSYRKAEWWQELADCLDEKDQIQFSVDGLQHNNHIYRVNADWPSIETGMRIITKSKAFTEWKWILFNYNQFDVAEGFKLAKSMGFTSFNVIETRRNPPGMEATRPYSDVLKEIERLQRES